MLVLLIGLVYSGNKKGYKELLGSFVDLYRFYSYFSQLTSNIYLLTDVTNPDETDLRDAVAEGIISEHVLSLYRRLSWEEKLVTYKSRGDLEKFLEIKQDKELFLYFSGHCSQGNLLFPDISINSLEFRRSIEQRNLCGENFFIFDCCNADGMKLPFLWKDDRYVLSKYPYFSTKKTLCLCSTLPKEDSASKITGSVFTNCFLRQLEEKKDLSTLMKSINEDCNRYPQTATLYASLPNLKRLWSWLYKKEEKLNLLEISLEELNEEIVSFE